MLKKNLEKEKAVARLISTARRLRKKHTLVFLGGRGMDRHTPDSNKVVKAVTVDEAKTRIKDLKT